MKIKSLILVHCIQLVAAGSRITMPVFLIDNENIFRGLYNAPTNPFFKMTTLAFTDMIRTSLHRTDRVIIFVEDTFSFEDLSAKDKDGSAFFHLHRGLVDLKVKFIPTVIEPFKTLVAMFPALTPNVFYLKDNLKDFRGNLKYYYIFFHDHQFNETRVEKLRRHDNIMRTAFFALRERSPGPLVAFYTGKINPTPIMGHISYQPLQTTTPPPEPAETSSVMIVTEGALFKLSGMYSISGPNTLMLSAPVAAEQTASSPRAMLTRMLYTDFELEFEFSYQPEQWTLEAVALLEGGETVGRTEMGVGAPWDWSFYCAEPICITNDRDGSAVVLSQYQVEPLIKNYFSELDPDDDYDSYVSKTVFTNTKNCGPYFSAVILAGLFVVFVLLLILGYGVVTLFNCQSNSTYDDMNQKPLVIVAQL